MKNILSNPNSYVCVHGKAFNYILRRFKEEEIIQENTIKQNKRKEDEAKLQEERKKIFLIEQLESERKLKEAENQKEKALKSKNNHRKGAINFPKKDKEVKIKVQNNNKENQDKEEILLKRKSDPKPEIKPNDDIELNLSHFKKENQNKKDKFTLYDYYKLIVDAIYSKGKIFYRMKPDSKVQLVVFYKQHPENMTVMCGDGANDCGATLSSDIGK